MSAATLAKLSFRLNQAAELSRNLPGVLPGVIFLTDDDRMADPVPTAAALPAGSAVILRHYNSRRREEVGSDLLALCRERHLKLLIAGDWRLAWKLGAHGVHLPEWQVRRPPPLRRKPGWLITAAAHNHAALVRAARLGAHGALLSPVFPTTSHLGAPAMGPHKFAGLTRSAPLAVYGLGGVTGSNARRLTSSGASGLAAISGLVP